MGEPQVCDVRKSWEGTIPIIKLVCWTVHMFLVFKTAVIRSIIQVPYFID